MVYFDFYAIDLAKVTNVLKCSTKTRFQDIKSMAESFLEKKAHL